MSELQELPLFPLGTVLFPGMMLPLHIFEERYKMMMQYCITSDAPFGVVLIREGSEVGGGATVFDIGTTAHITQVDQLNDGRMNIASMGLNRFRIHETIEGKQPYLVGLVEDFPFDESDALYTQQEADKLTPLLKKYLDIMAELTQEDISLDTIPKSASTLAFLTAIILRATMLEKQDLLSQQSLAEMMHQERSLLLREVQMLETLVRSAPKWRHDDLPFSPN